MRGEASRRFDGEPRNSYKGISKILSPSLSLSLSLFVYYTNLAWCRTSQRGRVLPSSSRGSTTRDFKQNRKEKKEKRENERKARRLELIENARVSSHSINRQMDYRVLSNDPFEVTSFPSSGEGRNASPHY